MNEGAGVKTIVWLSRAVTWVVLVALVATFTRNVITKPATWIGLLVIVGLGGPAIVRWVRAAEEARRAQALRRASVVTTAIAAALVMPPALIETYTLDAVLLVAAYSALFAGFGAAFADLAIARIVPAAWRAADTRIWTPNNRQLLALVLAWPLLTWVCFDFITARTGDSSCVVDGRCAFGVPFRFLSFGGWHGGRSMEWDKFWVDVGMLASLFLAAYGVAASRLRPFFITYLLAISYWLISACADAWTQDSMSRRMWREAELFERSPTAD